MLDPGSAFVGRSGHFCFEPEWRQLQNELSPKNLDWWNLVRGLIGLKDRSKRCLYWLECSFRALESLQTFIWLLDA